MSKTWVLTVQTNIEENGESRFNEYTKKQRVFTDFEKAKAAMQDIIKSYATQSNELFDGDGNLKFFTNFVNGMRYHPDYFKAFYSCYSYFDDDCDSCDNCEERDDCETINDRAIFYDIPKTLREHFLGNSITITRYGKEITPTGFLCDAAQPEEGEYVYWMHEYRGCDDCDFLYKNIIDRRWLYTPLFQNIECENFYVVFNNIAMSDPEKWYFCFIQSPHSYEEGIYGTFLHIDLECLEAE